MAQMWWRFGHENGCTHTERNRFRAAYNRAEYLDERRAMMAGVGRLYRHVVLRR